MAAEKTRRGNAVRRAARRWAAALCLLGLALGPAALPAAAQEGGAQLVPAQEGTTLSLPCRAAILVDQATGTVLYEKDADRRMPIASITKVMTLLLTFEAIHDGKLTLDTPVPVSEHAASMGGSQIWLEPGEHFTLDEMLRAICVSSANDAAVAVAELVGGTEEAFVARMNAKAAELGMADTTFKNACGLDTEGHLSTARDVAVMSRAILNECPEVLHYSGIWTDTLRGGETMLVNTNKLLRRYEGITGLKTGTTGGAGVCPVGVGQPGRAGPDRGGAGVEFQRRAVRRGHPPAGLRLCQLRGRAPARPCGPAALSGSDRRRRGRRAAGLQRPARPFAGAQGRRRGPVRRGGAARIGGGPAGQRRRGGPGGRCRPAAPRWAPGRCMRAPARPGWISTRRCA